MPRVRHDKTRNDGVHCDLTWGQSVGVIAHLCLKNKRILEPVFIGSPGCRFFFVMLCHCHTVILEPVDEFRMKSSSVANQMQTIEQDYFACGTVCYAVQGGSNTFSLWMKS